MEPLRSLPPIAGGARVQERAAGGNRQQAEAFRKALQEEGGQAKQEEAPMRRQLQKQPPAGRKEIVNARHVDVLA